MSFNDKAADGSTTDSRPNAKTYTTQSIPGYYGLLGIKPNASVQEIRRAYRDLSKLYHPDTTELESAIAIPKFQALNEAYATLSSPEKRLSYDYKSGYSRISVMQPLSSQRPPASRSNSPHDWSSSAYLDPTDRPLSAGEMFALFILGVTFVGCLVLVIAIGWTQDDLGVTDLEALMDLPEKQTEEQAATTALDPTQFRSELPESPWLAPKPPSTQAPPI